MRRFFPAIVIFLAPLAANAKPTVATRAKSAKAALIQRVAPGQARHIKAKGSRNGVPKRMLNRLTGGKRSAVRVLGKEKGSTVFHPTLGVMRVTEGGHFQPRVQVVEAKKNRDGRFDGIEILSEKVTPTDRGITLPHAQPSPEKQAILRLQTSQLFAAEYGFNVVGLPNGLALTSKTDIETDKITITKKRRFWFNSVRSEEHKSAREQMRLEYGPDGAIRITARKSQLKNARALRQQLRSTLKVPVKLSEAPFQQYIEIPGSRTSYKGK